MNFFFWLFALSAVISAVLMITRRNPVHCALWLVATMISLAGIYILLNAEFLAMVVLFVYAGGIMLLYIFVIMLVSIKEKRVPERYLNSQWVIACVLAILFFFIFLKYIPYSSFKGIPSQYSPEEVASLGGNIKAFGKELFTKYILPFEVASILLVAGMLGAVVLGRGFGLMSYLQDEEEQKAYLENGQSAKENKCDEG